MAPVSMAASSDRISSDFAVNPRLRRVYKLSNDPVVLSVPDTFEMHQDSPAEIFPGEIQLFQFGQAA